jgi:hypothetical protein
MIRSAATKSSGSTERLSHKVRGRSSRRGLSVLHVLVQLEEGRRIDRSEDQPTLLSEYDNQALEI